MKKYLAVLLIFLIFLILITGCNNDVDPTQKTRKTPKQEVGLPSIDVDEGLDAGTLDNIEEDLSYIENI